MLNSLLKSLNPYRSGCWSVLEKLVLALGIAAVATSLSQAEGRYGSINDRWDSGYERMDDKYGPYSSSSIQDRPRADDRYQPRSFDRFEIDSFDNGRDNYRSRDPVSRPVRDRPVPRKAPAKTDAIRLKIAQRYSNPTVERFLKSVSVDQCIRLYREASRLIDSRHLEPVSYQRRTQQAITNLMYALDSRAFQRINGLSVSRNQIDTFRSSLRSMAAQRPVRNAGDALAMMNTSMQLGQRQLGLKPVAVALEFVYGAIDSLDKYSGFVPAEVARRPSADLDDHVVGIGVEIKPDERGVLIVKPVRGGPAMNVGLRKGDIIIGVNGRSLAGQSLDFAADLISGPAGSQVVLEVVRDGHQPGRVRVTRRRVTIYSVSEVQMLDRRDGVGYIKLDKFAKSTTKEMDRALWELHGKGMTSLVLDLRGNPGGLLTTVVELSNRFLPRGSIVSTRGRTADDQSAEYATYDRTWKVPLVVLIDENSASASEIFAAAIQENKRGLVVGRTSYGKGTVQTHFPLQSVPGNIRLTTARFYSPNGRAMAGSGVTPDIPVTGFEMGDESRADRDIQAALGVVTSERLKQMADLNSGRRTLGSRD